ncbi:unnamed protein product [Nippostrongylus brasiliensis]|uniref:Wsv419-like protein n=1 Tax=Nippostrongylus brasiliensis TaxID=27835 RepID=A0A0N4XUX4_NIPBR|nr:unnamed protein product [Nippostrongylus brasiliensis]
MLDEELATFSDDLNRMCDDGEFVKTYFRAAVEEIGGVPVHGGLSCMTMVNATVDIVLDDEREPAENLMDTIRKVCDVVAFERIRNKHPKIEDAFDLTREFFKKVRQKYLEFVNSTTSKQSSTASGWYSRAARIELELLMKTTELFDANQLNTVSKEYFSCTSTWILGIDEREKIFCASRAWRKTMGLTSIPTRVAGFLDDLRSINVTVVNDRVYVKPAYTLLFLNTSDEALLAPALRKFAVFTLSIDTPSSSSDHSATNSSDPLQRVLHRTVNSTNMQDNCRLIESDLPYNIVSLRALFGAWTKGEETLQDTGQLFFSSSPSLQCHDKRQLAVDQANVAFSQSADFLRVYGCKTTDPMSIAQVYQSINVNQGQNLQACVAAIGVLFFSSRLIIVT